MTNQQIQQFQLNTFNKWCELSDDEREDYCHGCGLISFIEEQENYNDCFEELFDEELGYYPFENLLTQMTTVMFHGYNVTIATYEVFSERACRTTVYIVTDYEDGHTQRYEIDMYEGQPDNDRTNDCFTNYAENQLEHPTDFIFLKSFNH